MFIAFHFSKAVHAACVPNDAHNSVSDNRKHPVFQKLQQISWYTTKSKISDTKYLYIDRHSSRQTQHNKTNQKHFGLCFIAEIGLKTVLLGLSPLFHHSIIRQRNLAVFETVV